MSNEKQNTKKPTLQDVAIIAGVSVSTVSHVLNKTAKISDVTKARVMEAVHTLNYRPASESAGRLFRQNRKTIGVIVQDIRNEFYAACAGSILGCADNSAYTVLLCDCEYDLQREIDIVQELIYQNASGLIFFGGTDDSSAIQLADGYGIPVVLANRRVSGFSSVTFNHTKIIRELISMLHKANRKEYLYLSESLDLQSISDRRDGFCLGMMDCGVSPNNYSIVCDKRLQLNKVDMGYVVLEEYIDTHHGVDFDTIITSSDLIAIGVLKCLAKHDYRVPEDIWVLGYDDISVASIVSPSLTTIRQDTDRLGEEAFSLLNEMIQSGNHRPKQIMIENTLVIRESAF